MTSPLPRRIGRQKRHHALADGRHLRPLVEVHDRGDDVAAERRPNLQQQILVLDLRFRIDHVVDFQIGAVGGHARAKLRGHARRQIAAERRGAVNHDLRPMLADDVRQHPGVRQRRKMRQPRIIDHIDLVDALGNELGGQAVHAGAGQHRAGLHAQPVGQFAGLAAEFQRHIVQRAVFLLRIHPHFALTVRFKHW